MPAFTAAEGYAGRSTGAEAEQGIKSREYGKNRTGVIGVAWELLQDRMQRLDYREFGFQTEEEMRYHNDFFLFGMTAMLRRWVAGDCRETPHELCEILARQYSPNIRAFFRGWEK